MNNDFEVMPKIKRLSRDMVITEKLDGTNGTIMITDTDEFLVGSKNRWITPQNDNFGFARWAYEHEEELRQLGYGRHRGEWWGQGIQRGYGLDHKRFSLFNTGIWTDENTPECVSVVPVLYTGMFDTAVVDKALWGLHEFGSVAAPGFMDPEGVVVFHTHSGQLFKKTLDNNDDHKFLHEGEK